MIPDLIKTVQLVMIHEFKPCYDFRYDYNTPVRITRSYDSRQDFTHQLAIGYDSNDCESLL